MWAHVIAWASSPGPHPEELVEVKRTHNQWDASPKGSADCAGPAMTDQHSAAGQQAMMRHRTLYHSYWHGRRCIFVQSSDGICQWLPAPCRYKLYTLCRYKLSLRMPCIVFKGDWCPFGERFYYEHILFLDTSGKIPAACPRKASLQQ